MSNTKDISGFLLLDKPTGISSNEALQKVKSILRAKKAGHTGSLDPLANGMLPICLGAATKFSQFLLNADKKYYVWAKLGSETTTGDAEGEKVQTSDCSNITKERAEAVLQEFFGEQEQIPPMYSALKHQGQPLYKLARNGIEVERKPRKINIYQLELMNFVNDELILNVSCSKGTYIRTLVQDIGRRLGCYAYVGHLTRYSIGSLNSDRMIGLSELEAIAKSDVSLLSESILSINEALSHLPSVSLDQEQTKCILNGQKVSINNTESHGISRLLANGDIFLGVGEVNNLNKIIPRRISGFLV